MLGGMRAIWSLAALAMSVTARRSRQPADITFGDFIPPAEFLDTCMKIAKEVGGKSADPELSQSVCEKYVGESAEGDVKQHCEYFALQMEQATLQEVYKGPLDFCGKMLQFHSYKLQSDLLLYLKPKIVFSMCGDAINLAIEQGGDGTGKTEAIQANLPVACKQTVEAVYEQNGMPRPSASVACKMFMGKADSALSAGELDPEDLGEQFCKGNSMGGKAFEASGPSPMPQGFPLTEANWQPKITLAHLRDLVRHAFSTPRDCFKKFDKNGDGKMEKGEWKKMCKSLGVPTQDAKLLLGQSDENKDGGVTPEEFDDAMGVLLPELVVYSNQKHGNAEKAWKAADKNGDGNLDPKEFENFCKDMGVSPTNAEMLLPEVDKDGSGGVSQEEFFDVMGVDVPELKRRARKKHGPPEKAYAAFDPNGDKKMTPEEFEKGCEDLGIPPNTAKKLMKEIDTDGSGDIDPKEWGAAMGMDEKDLQKEVLGNLGGADKAVASMDKDGDGLVSPEEMAEGLKKAGASPEEAKKLAKKLDKDGDGKISPEELHKGAGGKAMDKKRGFPKGGKGGPGVTVPDFRDRVKAKHGTPKKAFDAFDTAPKDGKLSPAELAAGAKLLEPPVSPEDAAKLFPKIDKDGDKGISPEEFFEALGGCKDCGEKFGIPMPEFKKRVKDKHGKPKDGFDAMDADKDGKLSPKEFELGCKKLNPPITPEEAADLMKRIDVDPADGAITPEEFFKAIGGEPAALSPDAMDADGDGKVSPEERLKALDKDGDGKVSPEELNKAMDADGDGKVSPEEKMKAMDKDGDGKVSPEEMAEAAKAGNISPADMQKMDKDGDGKVSPEEMAEAADETSRAAEPKEQMKKALKGKFKSPKEAAKAMDKDGDGKISPEEMEAGLREQGVSPEQAKKMVKDADQDGDGKVSPEELYTASGGADKFAPSPGEPGYKAPAKPKEAEVTKGDMKKRLGQAFKSGKDAWDKIAGPGAKEMTKEQFKKKAKDLGIPPGEAEKLFDDMDKDGDGKVSQDEFQNTVGVDDDEVQDRFLDEFGNADEALKAADADGDGKVSPEELEKVMEEKLGLTPENAKKAAKEMMKKMDPDGDGSVSAEDFKEATKAKADDMQNRIEEKIGSAPEAFEKWDVNPKNGQLDEAEFLAGAKKLGFTEDAAKDMWKEADKGADGTMNPEEFARAFGVGPDEVMERCFQYFGNPTKAFDQIDKNHDGLLSPAEWSDGAKIMNFKKAQADRLFKDMDTNHKESTGEHLSRWEFYDYLEYEEPHFRSTGDGYGDIDPWGFDHKKFNELPHTAESMLQSKEVLPAPKASPTRSFRTPIATIISTHL